MASVFVAAGSSAVGCSDPPGRTSTVDPGIGVEADADVPPDVRTADGCAGETDEVLRIIHCGLNQCGSQSVKDRCGTARTIDCGAACDTPPGSTCANATTRKLYPAKGTCSSGKCTYAPTETACAAGLSCSGGSCVGGTKEDEVKAKTATSSGAGLSDCGANSSDVCARSLLTPGGSFFRGEDKTKPATITDFRLDKYEVTVGRFRAFVDAWIGGWRPAPGSGKHAHLAGGSGVTATGGGKEPGWDRAWNDFVGAASKLAYEAGGPAPANKKEWDTNLSCDPAFQSWTSSVGPNEKRPMTCLTWYEAHAFCIWDGGFLPTEAEWEYAAAGGSDERMYAWGPDAPDSTRAVFDNAPSTAVVGSVPAGDGRWGHSDLAGNVWEWTLDWIQPYEGSCADCANLTTGYYRSLRGGAFGGGAMYLPAVFRDSRTFPALRAVTNGARCARTP